MKNKQLVFVAVIIGLSILGYGYMKYIYKVNVLKSEIPKKTLLRKTTEEWFQVGMDYTLTYCTKQTPYNNKPEFQRAISLISQRMAPELAEWEKGQNVTSNSPIAPIFSLKNCLDIQYASLANELGSAEGVFYFDNNVSGTDKLKILVSPTYKSQDDVVTAYLLVHEIYHAIQFVTESSWGVVLEECYKNDTKDYCDGLAKEIHQPFYWPDCITKEANAYLVQRIFISSLKPVEKNTLALRATQQEMTRGSDSQIQNIMENVTYINNLQSQGICKADDGACFRDNLVKRLQSTDFYREQCDL